jgi:hypothetical protein
MPHRVRDTVPGEETIETRATCAAVLPDLHAVLAMLRERLGAA